MKSNLIIIALIASFALVGAQNIRFGDVEIGFNRTKDIQFQANATFVNITEVLKNATNFNRTDAFFNKTSALNLTNFFNQSIPLFNETLNWNNTYNLNDTIIDNSGDEVEYQIFSYNLTGHHNSTNSSQFHNGTFNGTHWNQTHHSNNTFFNATRHSNHSNWNATHPSGHNRTEFNWVEFNSEMERLKNNTPHGHYNYTHGNSTANYTLSSSGYGYSNSSTTIGQGYNGNYNSSSHNSTAIDFNFDFFDDDMAGFIFIGALFKLALTIGFFYIIAKWWKNRQERLRYTSQAQILPAQNQQQYFQLPNQQFLQQGAYPQQVPMYPQQQQPVFFQQGYPQPVQQQQQRMFNNPIPQVQQIQPIQVNIPQQSQFENQQQMSAYPQLKPSN